MGKNRHEVASCRAAGGSDSRETCCSSTWTLNQSRLTELPSCTCESHASFLSKEWRWGEETRFPGPHEGGPGAGKACPRASPCPGRAGLGSRARLKNQPRSPPHRAAPLTLCNPAFVPAPVPSSCWPPTKARTPLVAQAALMSSFPEEKAHGSTVGAGQLPEAPLHPAPPAPWPRYKLTCCRLQD